MLGIRVIESASGFPGGPLITVGWEAPRFLELMSRVHQVPRHKRRVALRELVVEPGPGSVLALIAVAEPRPRFSNPTGVGLWRDHVSDVLQRIENAHRTMLDAILIASNEAPANASVVGVLTGVIELRGIRVQALNNLLADRRLFPKPDRRSQHQDVGRLYGFVQRGPVICVRAVLGHIWINPDSDVKVNGSDDVDMNIIGVHDRGRDIDQRAGV